MYDLAYDGGYSIWIGYYRTYWGARLAILYNVHLASWGGKAIIKDTRPNG